MDVSVARAAAALEAAAKESESPFGGFPDESVMEHQESLCTRVYKTDAKTKRIDF